MLKELIIIIPYFINWMMMYHLISWKISDLELINSLKKQIGFF